ncbi:MAG: ATP synthase F1 subunit gamma [Phycisphaerales bacterium]|nr:ATP synthase F1 subunit gamma [Phycisphaerales bacterium]
MAKARQIIKRRKAVQNIKKITQTMQLVSTARFQKCLQRATASKPYTEKIAEMIGALSGLESIDHPLLKPNESKQSIMLVMTSNRGLCGAYNASVLRTALAHERALQADGWTPSIEMVGKKGVNYLRFIRRAPAWSMTDVEDRIEYRRVAELATRYMTAYEAGKVGRVDIVYMQFISVGKQIPTIATLLPIEPPKVEQGANQRRVDFEFSPEPEKLLARLIPETVRIRLYQYFNEAIVSEQVFRMVAMKAATDAAGDMQKSLTREYNRARQSQITLELADIVGGAEAVK